MFAACGSHEFGYVVGAQIVLNGPSDSSGAPTSALRFFLNGVDQVFSAFLRFWNVPSKLSKCLRLVQVMNSGHVVGAHIVLNGPSKLSGAPTSGLPSLYQLDVPCFYLRPAAAHGRA